MYSTRSFTLATLACTAVLVLTACGVNAPTAPGQSQAQQSQPQTNPTTAPAGTPSNWIATPPPMPTDPPRPPTATPVSAPAGAGLASGPVLATSDFSDPAVLSSWTVIDSYDVKPTPSIWEIRDGFLHQVSDGDGLPTAFGTVAVTGDAGWKDYEVTLSAYHFGNEQFGVAARANEQGYYTFRILTTGQGATLSIARYEAATETYFDLATVSRPAVQERTWYRMTLRVEGNKLQGLLDGQPVLEASDATYTQGQAGAYGYAQGALQFDNFLVQALGQ